MQETASEHVKKYNIPRTERSVWAHEIGDTVGGKLTPDNLKASSDFSNGLEATFIKAIKKATKNITSSQPKTKVGYWKYTVISNLLPVKEEGTTNIGYCPNIAYEQTYSFTYIFPNDRSSESLTFFCNPLDENNSLSYAGIEAKFKSIFENIILEKPFTATSNQKRLDFANDKTAAQPVAHDDDDLLDLETELSQLSPHTQVLFPASSISAEESDENILADDSTQHTLVLFKSPERLPLSQVSSVSSRVLDFEKEEEHAVNADLAPIDLPSGREALIELLARQFTPPANHSAAGSPAFYQKDQELRKRSPSPENSEESSESAKTKKGCRNLTRFFSQQLPQQESTRASSTHQKGFAHTAD